MIKANYFAPVLLLAVALGVAPVRASTPQDDLQAVLAQMNYSGVLFKWAKADFEWEQYTLVVKQSDMQKGTIYFRRKGESAAIAIRIVSPARKHILIDNGKAILYDEKIDQITERELGKDRADFEAIMRLGFGSRGDDLLKSFEVKLAGWEMVDGVRTAKLELIPTLPSYRKAFSKVFFWIDPARDIALKQQFFEPSGDYRLVHNINIEVNGKPLPDDAFRMEHTNNKK